MGTPTHFRALYRSVLCRVTFILHQIITIPPAESTLLESAVVKTAMTLQLSTVERAEVKDLSEGAVRESHVLLT